MVALSEILDSVNSRSGFVTFHGTVNVDGPNAIFDVVVASATG